MDAMTAPLTGLEWDHLVEAGLLDGQPIELVGGRKVVMSPISSVHSAVTQRLLNVLLTAAHEVSMDVRPANPLALSPMDRPEPDIAVVIARADYYRSGHPAPEDVRLVVEVSRSSLAFDLGEKAARYAEAGIDDYWVVDVEAEITHVHRSPQPGRGTWAEVRLVPFGSPLRPMHVDLDIVLPPSG